MTHRDGVPRLSARSAWRGDAGPRKPRAPSQSHGQPESPWEAAVPVAQANRQRANGRASESLDDVPHRPRLPSYPPVGPTHRLPDLYGSLSAFLGISPEHAAQMRLAENDQMVQTFPSDGIVRANSFTLPKRQNRISRQLIFLHFSESI